MIEYYDVKGNAIFRKTKVDYLPKGVATDGQYIICYYEKLDLTEWNVSPEVEQEKDRIFILNYQGEVVFEDEMTRYISGVYISPNNIWMTYLVEEGTMLYRYVNLEERKIVKNITNNGIPKSGISFIGDNGLIYFMRVTGKVDGWRNVKMRCSYNPMTDEIKEIRKDIQKNSWEK